MTRSRRNSGHSNPRRGVLLMVLLLAVVLLSQTAFAKNTYLISDGTRVFTYESYATDPAEVLQEAGLKLDEFDTFTAETTMGNTTLTIQRSQMVSVDYHGETMEVAAYHETVGELLTRLNIYPSEKDMLSASMDAEVYDGMTLQIREVFQEEQTYTAAIAHETTYYYSDALPEGMEEVMTRGEDGEMLCTALVTYVNGQETERKILSEAVTVNPVTEVIARGTGLRESGIATGGVVIGENTITLSTGEVLTYTGTMQVRASGYTHTDAGCDMLTFTETIVHVGTVAVDPEVIPYGTRMFIVSNDGSYVYGISVAEDCGGAIKKDRVDLYFPTTSECFQFGRRDCTVYFLG